MKKTIIMLVPVCCLLAACAPEKEAMLHPENCPSGPADRNCPKLPDGTPDPAHLSKVRLVVSAAGINPQPPAVCTNAGDVIKVTVVGIPDTAIITTAPKDDVNAWILSSRTGVGDMSIKVPDATPTGDYEYLAITTTGKCVDPIFHVN
jgi:hypothetical protein